MVYQLTKFYVQRVDMVINPPWNLPFLGAKGLTSPKQTATGGFKGVPRPLLPVILSIVAPSVGQEAPSVTQHQPSSSVVPPTPPTTQPIPSEAITISPLSQPAPPTPIAETTTASPLPSPSPAHEPMEHTFEQPSSDQQPPLPRQEATTSQLMTRIDNLEKQLKETKQTFGKAILTLAREGKTNDLDPLVSLVQELVTPSKIVNASGEEQVEDIGPTTLEAAAILTKVKKIKSVDNKEERLSEEESKEFAVWISILALDPVTTDALSSLRFLLQTEVEEKERLLRQKKKRLKLLKRQKNKLFKKKQDLLKLSD
ncbi:hypothetical protein Tco_1192413 [Tanacetum coccineum]